MTTGEAIDPDGYEITITGYGSARIGANETIRIAGLQPGDHEVRLEGLASNCVWSESPTAYQLATVPSGGTTQVSFAVVCYAQPSSRIVVRAVTSGPPPFFIYFVGIDGREVGAVGATSGSSTFQVSAGEHRVGLDAGRCSVVNNNRLVVVAPAATVYTTFQVTCP